MTKEAILHKHVKVFNHEGEVAFEGIDTLTPESAIYKAMSEYASQCTAPLEARIRELEEGLREILNFCKTEKATVMNNVPPQSNNVAFTSASTENMVYSIVADRLTNLLSSSSSDGWISVEEGLPPNLAFCWAYSNIQGKVIMTIYSKSDNWFQSLSGSYLGVAGSDVEFYQPLIFPKPPKH